jgi:hypothetical protein
MEHRKTQSPDIPKWSALLVEAVTKPGLIMKAYSAFHHYSLGNQLLALVQCQMRGLQPGPINLVRRGFAARCDSHPGFQERQGPVRSTQPDGS